MSGIGACALLICVFGTVASEEAGKKVEGLDIKLACLATFLPDDPEPHNVVFPIAHLGMRSDFESRVATVLPRMPSRPVVVLETRPAANPLVTACKAPRGQDGDDRRRRVAALVSNAPGVQRRGLHPALVAALPSVALYFLAAAECSGQFGPSPLVSTEARIGTVAIKVPLQVDYLEDSDAFLCSMMAVREKDLLEGVVSQIEACHEHDAATQGLFDAIHASKDIEQARMDYGTRLGRIGHHFLGSEGFVHRDAELRKRVEAMATAARGSRLIFVGAYHLPEWMKDGGRSPAGWEVRDLCR